MKIIGITGGIASGKSLVTTFLREAGLPVIDADEVYHELLRKDVALLARLRADFGDGVFHEDGGLNRKALGKIVFADRAKLDHLSSITHPAVRAAMRRRTEEASADGAKLVFWAVPLLFEGGMNELVDEVVVVWAPQASMLERLMKRNDLTEEQAKRRIASQMDIEEKRRRADHLIDNAGSISSTRAQTLELLAKLQQ